MHDSNYHISLFIFGFIYYLVTPLFVVSSRIWEDYPGVQILYKYYKDEYILGYLVIVFLLGFFYLLGSYIPIISNKRNWNTILTNKTVYSSKGLFAASFPVLLFSQFHIFTNRGSLFQGYQIEMDNPFVGAIATTAIFYLFLFIYNKKGNYSRNINTILVIILIELSFVMLGVGTRMYFLVILVTIILYMHDNNVLPTKKIILLGGTGIFLLLLVGIWRLGTESVSLENIIYIGIAEPTFTWISAISMYDLNKLPMFSIPYNFASSFINFLPSIIFPDKAKMVSDISLNYDSPLGAISVFASVISNFGIIGSFLAFFVLGFLISYIRLHWKSVFGQTYYYCICGVIPFQLFRDPFTVVNKVFFSNLLLVPVLFIFLHRMLKGALSK